MPARASRRSPSRGVEFNTFATAWSGVRWMAGVNSPYLGGAGLRNDSMSVRARSKGVLLTLLDRPCDNGEA
jgi:hypothetical protein